MISAQVTIHTPHGLHLRPAGELAEEALKYRCRVSLAHGDKEISAKSLLGILSLCIRQDTEITVVCDGMDEQEALASQYGIQVVPTLLFFERGELKKRTSGYMDLASLKGWLELE